MKKLSEVIEVIGGFDICDEVFDYGIYYDYDSEEKNDYYDKTLKLVADKIEFIKYQKDWYSCCNITKFIEENQVAIDKFMDIVYKEQYTPRFICKKNNIDKITSDDEIFADVYLDLFFNDLAIGNLTDNEYKQLYKLLSENESESE